MIAELLGVGVRARCRASWSARSRSPLCSAGWCRSSGAVCRRLASYAAQAPQSLAPERIAPLAQDAIDLIVFLAKVPDGEGRRRRVVASVREVHGSLNGDLQAPELFTPGADGRAVPAGLQSRWLFELEAVGFDRSCLEPGGVRP